MSLIILPMCDTFSLFCYIYTPTTRGHVNIYYSTVPVVIPKSLLPCEHTFAMTQCPIYLYHI